MQVVFEPQSCRSIPPCWALSKPHQPERLVRGHPVLDLHELAGVWPDRVSDSSTGLLVKART